MTTRTICCECIFSTQAGEMDVCQMCRASISTDLVSKSSQAWGVTVEQTKEAIADAWKAAMGTRKFAAGARDGAIITNHAHNGRIA